MTAFSTQSHTTASQNSVAKADATVSLQPTDARNHYTSVQAAVNAAPKEGGWTIAIAPGSYYERVVITTPNLTLVGAGMDATRIYFGRYAGQPVKPGSNETWGTFRTATVDVDTQNIHLANMTIENSFDYRANEARGKADADRVNGEQAVALKTGEYADKIVVENVRLLGFQDTLYVQGGRSYFSGGEIHGHVDFIFGNGNALFEGVDIYSRSRLKPQQYTGFITAPSTLITDEFGLTFINCRLLKEDNVPDGSVPLGRPWHPTTTFADGRYANPFAVGKSVFINTFMDSHIATEGWTSMGGSTPEGGRKEFSPITEARFREYNSNGPGAVKHDSRPQLSGTDVEIYSKYNILDGWQPALLATKP
ncbi:pectin esterase [Alteromonas pelagimontana]|uniref:Pectin esterase n=2 Tax=Alteromonas pelagimontana TaxID=1858656 RepID=A0A6M4MI00_9ALTE|nr:pectin esterase [Alteromonas pelagimontana]